MSGRSLLRRPWTPAFALGVLMLSIVVLLVLVALRDGARFWRMDFTRGQAVEASRDLAPKVGLESEEVAGWEARQALRRLSSAESYLAYRLRNGQPIERPGALTGAKEAVGDPPGLSPLTFDLVLEEPEGVQSIEARWAAHGELRALSRRPAPAPQETEPEVAEALAQAGLELLAGAPPEGSAALFEVYDSGTDGGITRYRWRWQPEDDADLQLNARVQIRGDETIVYSMDPVVDVDLLRAVDARPLLENAFTALLVLAGFAYLIYTLLYHQPHRRALLVGAVVTLLSLGWVILTFQHRAFFADGAIGAFFAALFNPVLFHGLLAALLFGAGQVALRHARPFLVEGLEFLLRGRWRARPVIAGVRDGLVAGVGVAMLPYLVALVLPGLLPFGLSEEILSAAHPGWAVLWPRIGLVTFGWLLLIEPLCLRILRWKFVARPAAVVAGGFLLASEMDAAGVAPELLVAGLFSAVALDLVFHRFGILAALVAAFGASVASGAAVLTLQPGGLRLSGVFAFAVLVGAVTLLSARVARAAADELAAEDLRVPRRLRAERERILAQLSVAREAQMRMLPEAPPHLPGFELAASCRPAKEVGGDLYDFIPLGGGNGASPWGIALGDVSGKGMVASLYMTLTKGLLLAAAEHTVEPCAMLADVNRGLYQESDRNIFVTLWYGVLHPETRVLHHVRAGHNPALWRRASKGETVLLKPPGFALGGTSSKLFNRLLKAEEITLEEGDALFVYSDGLTEAMNETLEEYGDRRLREAVGRTDGMSAERAMNAILADVHAFAGDAPQHDDMTLVVLRVG